MNTIIEQFKIQGSPIYCERYGSGHINKTYDIKTDAGKRYILQRINNEIFRNVEGLMHNIELVTAHLQQVSPKEQKPLQLIETLDGHSYYEDAESKFWRMWKFVSDSVCLNRAENAEDFYQSALAFGGFSQQMSDFDAKLLVETIPRFHDTPLRFEQLKEAITEDPLGRVAEVQREIAFALAREDEAHIMVDMMQEGKLPLRVTHNDTKLNNVMLDLNTRKPLCVIDLDCVMPGLLGNDFGDSIRFGASTGDEDEQDLSKINLDLALYEAYTKGFMEACGEAMTPEEIETLPLSAKLMTLECGVRFLTDHIKGDVYFGIRRNGHNLDRARTQFKLVADMEEHMDEMIGIVEKYRK